MNNVYERKERKRERERERERERLEKKKKKKGGKCTKLMRCLCQAEKKGTRKQSELY